MESQEEGMPESALKWIQGHHYHLLSGLRKLNKRWPTYELNTCFCNICGKIGHFPAQCSKENQASNTSFNAQENQDPPNGWNIVDKKKMGGPRKQNSGNNNLERGGKEKMSNQFFRSENVNQRTAGIFQSRRAQYQWKQKNRDIKNLAKR